MLATTGNPIANVLGEILGMLKDLGFRYLRKAGYRIRSFKPIWLVWALRHTDKRRTGSSLQFGDGCRKCYVTCSMRNLAITFIDKPVTHYNAI
jgi:hypothetical protein